MVHHTPTGSSTLSGGHVYVQLSLLYKCSTVDSRKSAAMSLLIWLILSLSNRNPDAKGPVDVLHTEEDLHKVDAGFLNTLSRTPERNLQQRMVQRAGRRDSSSVCSTSTSKYIQ